MLQINQIKLPIELITDTDAEIRELQRKAAKKLGVANEAVIQLSILKKALDARKKPQLFYSYNICCSVKNEEKILKRAKAGEVQQYTPSPYVFPQITNKRPQERPIIIGMGPAGLFCGYLLAQHGFAPIIFERGKRVEERTQDVLQFWNHQKLLSNSNVAFGEGGAGTFSDGKLNTLIKDKTGRNQEVLRIFVENGAPEHILYDSKPHIGTDVLSRVVANMRKRMLAWGAQIHYESQLTEVLLHEDKVAGIVINEQEEIKAQTVVLAIGHSARDTFSMLYSKHIPMEGKDFAVGFRVQHPQDFIDISQYGRPRGSELQAASYKLAAKTSVGRGVYSFCMCPGGYVVNASSEKEMLAINGMSYSGRDSSTANSVIIMSVTQEDFPSNHPLAGVEFQRELEQKAYALAKGAIPIQYYHEFANTASKREYIRQPFAPCIKGAYAFADIRTILPPELTTAFIEGMTQFGRQLPGFDDDYCILAGIESRTSSPLRILRNKDLQSQIQGLYPCGEGAGYAGGITSAAMDGLAAAEAIAKKACL